MVVFYSEKIKQMIDACREPHHLRQVLRFYRTQIVRRELVTYFSDKAESLRDNVFSKTEREVYEDVLIELDIMVEKGIAMPAVRVKAFRPIDRLFESFSIDIDYAAYYNDNLAQDVMRELYIRTFNYYNGNKTQTAKTLGISVRTLSDNLKKIRGL